MFEEIADILKYIKNTIHGDTIIMWTDLKSVKELQRMVSGYIIRANKRDRKLLTELDLAFAPNGLFHILALSNNWNDSYQSLAKRFETAYQRLKGDYLNS